MNLRSAAFALASLCCSTVWAVPTGEAPPPEAPRIASASDEGEKAIKGFRVPTGLQAKLFAAEPMLANPVAFTIDPQGRVLVCETFRQGKGVEDNRGHDHWLNDDLAAMTVEDRLAYIVKHLKDKVGEYTKYDDRLRRLEDTDGDGVADKATVFAEHFNDILAGTGAGVLVHGKNVYYTNIPHLWLLRDETGDGVANVRKSLHSGYGVRFAFRGHDMHGLIVGPDGRLYFSIGDRGLNVKTADAHLVNPESGAVLRCELDGSKLELFATGLRNPQELAFDDLGNLFTGDNNSDSGDRARWTFIPPGADIGWRMAYQYLPDRGPFNREKIWHPYHAGQPAYIVPCIANITSGPSGLAYDPGTGLTDHFRQRFFLCDFRGGPAGSGVLTFRNKPKGAFFEVVESEESFWNVLATDVEFGPDGAVYLSDWVNGWNGEGKGRIYKFGVPDAEKSALSRQVQELLKTGLAGKSKAELADLLKHPDRRIRQAAQFAIADQGEAATFVAVAAKNDSQLARVHAIWGLGQLARRGNNAAQTLQPLVTLLADSDAEVRAQAANVLGEYQVTAAGEGLVTLLKDDSPRVRYFAALALGKIGRGLPELCTLLADNADADPIVRHGGIIGLAGQADLAAVVKETRTHASPAVRLAAVVALRKRGSSAVAEFLKDADPLVVVESARAIHDLPLNDALPQMAGLINRATTDDALLRRVLNANFRLGGAEHAQAVAAFAARASAPESLRIEALKMLANWAAPSPRDRVLGMWRPLENRSPELAVAALQASLPGIMAGPEKVRQEGVKIAAQLGIKEVGPALQQLLADKSQAPQLRADALGALVSLNDKSAPELVEKALADSAPLVRAAGRDALARSQPATAIPLLGAAALTGELPERQAALATLGQLKDPAADAPLVQALDQLLAGAYPAESTLDLLEAAAKHPLKDVAERLQKHAATRNAADPLAAWRETLVGGDVARGRTIFFERAQVSCVRCHKIEATGGDVGPELSHAAKEKTREYLLEAIVLPSKAIAKGFESVALQLDDGSSLTGILKAENEKELQLMTAEGKLLSIPKASIENRKPGKSAMPEDLPGKMSKSDLRDLVEYLHSLK